MISRLLKLSHYRGGPHFDRLSTLCFDLEGIGLELTTPASDLVMIDPPRMLNLPFNSNGWFEAHSKRREIRAYVPIFAEIWNYCPVGMRRLINLMAMSSNERMGCLSIGVHLNRLQGGKKLDLTDPQSLGDYIKWEYDDYYEMPSKGDDDKGWNHEIRAKYAKKWRHGQPGNGVW